MYCIMSGQPPLSIPRLPDSDDELCMPLVTCAFLLTILTRRKLPVLSLLDNAPFLAKSPAKNLPPSDGVLLDD